MFLVGRLKPGRIQPLAYVRAGLGLASLAEDFIAYRSVGEEFGLFAETPGFFGKAYFKGARLLNSAALWHGAALLESLNDSQNVTGQIQFL
jgi:hypothetical protein